ncbi:hypothetical protein QBC35DRAFT_270787 [Podospora australis]|uniref:Uncharacterized protein n=1 Tax=Podospora australis TaxID=1536484 RepID=A0AAN7AI03_9PEZI|nr:hypothetical protein QBC35DRAFT_270787 [Podospora australis]
MVSFFGLKLRDKKKKSDAKATETKDQPQGPKKFDQNLLGEGQFFGTNVQQTGVVINGSIRSVSRAGTPQPNPKSPYAVMDTHNLAAASMFDLGAVPRSGSQASFRPTLKAYASDVNLGARFAANNDSSASLAIPPGFAAPPPGFNSRPGTPNGRKKNWVNPLDVHFVRSTPTGPPSAKSPLAQTGFELPPTPTTDKADTNSAFGEEADNMVNAVMASVNKQEEEKKREAEQERELVRREETARLELERWERQKSSEGLAQQASSETKPQSQGQSSQSSHQRSPTSPTIPGAMFRGNVGSRPGSRNGPASRSPQIHQGPPPTGPPTHCLPQPPGGAPRQGPRAADGEEFGPRPAPASGTVDSEQGPPRKGSGPHNNRTQGAPQGNPQAPRPARDSPPSSSQGPSHGPHQDPRGNPRGRPGHGPHGHPGAHDLHQGPPGPPNGPSHHGQRQAFHGPAHGHNPQGRPPPGPHGPHLQGPPHRGSPPLPNGPYRPPQGPYPQGPQPRGPPPQNGPPNGGGQFRNGPPGPFRGPGPNGFRSESPVRRPMGNDHHRSESPAPRFMDNGGPGSESPARRPMMNTDQRSQSPAPRGFGSMGPRSNGPVPYGAAEKSNGPELSPLDTRPPPLISTLTSPTTETARSSLDDEFLAKLAPPVIQDVAAKRDTFTQHTSGQQSLSMKIEELEKSLLAQQPPKNQTLRPSQLQVEQRLSTSSSVYSNDTKDDEDDNDETILPVPPAPLRIPSPLPPSVSTFSPDEARSQSPFRPLRAGPQRPPRPSLEEYGVSSDQVTNSPRSRAQPPPPSDYTLRSPTSPLSRSDPPQLRTQPSLGLLKRGPTQPISPAPTPDAAHPPRPNPLIDTGFKFDFGPTPTTAPLTPDSASWPLSSPTAETAPVIPPVVREDPFPAVQDSSGGTTHTKFSRTNIPPPLNLKFNFSPDAPARDPSLMTPPLRSAPPMIAVNDGRPSTATGHHNSPSGKTGSSGLAASPQLVSQFPDFLRTKASSSPGDDDPFMGIGMARGPSIREVRRPGTSAGHGQKNQRMVDSFGTGFI